MSRYEWEAGTITLPSAAVTAVKKAVRDAHNAFHGDVLALCKEFWTDHAKRTRSQKKYNSALDAWPDAVRPRHGYPSWHAARQQHSQAAIDTAYDILADLASAPRQVQLRDLHPYGLQKMTSRNNEVHHGGMTVRFDGRRLYWSSGDNNHQVEHAHAHPVGEALFAALDKVKWTRGTGGVLTGNDEYNRDTTYDGGGANYITRAYGPVGEKERRFSRGF